MNTRITLFALACTAALSATATPMLDCKNIRAKDGIAYVDRQGATAFKAVFSKELSQWKVDNFENKLSMYADTYEGESAFIATLKGKNCDTAWDIISSQFDVLPGQDFTLMVRARGTISMEQSQGHGEGYATAIFWYDANGKMLDDLFNYGFRAVPDEWTDTCIEGTVPLGAVKAAISVGGDSPNFNQGDILAISRLDFLMRQPDMKCMDNATFTSVPVLTDGSEQKLSWSVKSAFSFLNFIDNDIAFQISTAPDANGRPGQWSVFAGPDGTDKSFYTSSGTTIKTPQPWLRYRATMFSNGVKTPLLQSVTIGKTTHSNWTVGDTSAPKLVMLTESPNQHPEKPITFRIEDDSPLDMPSIRCFFDGEEITPQIARKGNTFSYQEEMPFRPDAVSYCPLRWKISNYQHMCAFEPLEERIGAVRVKLQNGRKGDTSFHFTSMPLPVIEGKEYSFGMNIRHSLTLKGAAQKVGSITWVDSERKPIGSKIPVAIGETCKEWTLHSVKGTAPQGAVAAVVDIGFDVPDIGIGDYFDLDRLVLDGPVPPPEEIDKSKPHIHTVKVQGKDLCGNAFSEERVVFYGESVKENIVTMRDDGFVLIDGKPFFPRGFYSVSEKPFNHNSFDYAFKEFRKNGFNFAHTYAGVGETRKRLMDSAAANGIKVWVCLDGDFWNCIQSERNHPALLAWYLGDDTANHMKPDYVRRNHLLCHAIDNAHITTQADTVGGRYSSRYNAFVDSTDSFMPEIYPMLSAKQTPGQVPTVISQMETIKADIKRHGSPVKSIWAILQHFDGWGFKRFPTFEEQRAMTYLAIIHGAHGITWYTYGGDDVKTRGVASSPERWEEVCIIGRELETLDHAITARNAKTQPAVTIVSGPAEDALKHPSISRLLKDNDGRKILLTANSSVETVKASIKLNGFKKAKVLFENREVAIDSQGYLNDEFAKLAVHVYELE